MTKPASRDTLHRLTLEEIQRMLQEYNVKRRALTEELAAIYTGRMRGDLGEAPIPDRVRQARELAAGMLNGNAPEWLKLPPGENREAQLFIQRDAIDLVVRVLSEKGLAARAAAAVEWLDSHGGEWNALAREIILTGHRLAALEARATALRATMPEIPPGLLLGNFVGDQSLLSDRRFDGDPLANLSAAAVAAGIVSTADIRKAENVD